jgi:hypothetical protein
MTFVHVCQISNFGIKVPIEKKKSLKFFFFSCMPIQLFHVYKFLMSIKNLYKFFTNIKNMLMVDFIMVSYCFMNHNMSLDTHVMDEYKLGLLELFHFIMKNTFN